jgi:hypothetical protein
MQQVEMWTVLYINLVNESINPSLSLLKYQFINMYLNQLINQPIFQSILYSIHPPINHLIKTFENLFSEKLIDSGLRPRCLSPARCSSVQGRVALLRISVRLPGRGQHLPDEQGQVVFVAVGFITKIWMTLKTITFFYVIFSFWVCT